MSNPYVGEIRMFAGNFAPAGWMFCNGQLLPISQYETLFNLIGTTYGGDGQSTFALPNLQSRVPVDQGPGFTIAQTGGAETVTLITTQIPAHSHVAIASSASGPNQASSLNSSWVANTTLKPYDSGTNVSNNMATSNIGFTGNNVPHDNMLPYLGINFIISMFGVFPSPS
jgi:microcystin-dependent protein